LNVSFLFFEGQIGTILLEHVFSQHPFLLWSSGAVTLLSFCLLNSPHPPPFFHLRPPLPIAFPPLFKSVDESDRLQTPKPVNFLIIPFIALFMTQSFKESHMSPFPRAHSSRLLWLCTFFDQTGPHTATPRHSHSWANCEGWNGSLTLCSFSPVIGVFISRTTGLPKRFKLPEQLIFFTSRHPFFPLESGGRDRQQSPARKY